MVTQTTDRPVIEFALLPSPNYTAEILTAICDTMNKHSHLHAVPCTDELSTSPLQVKLHWARNSLQRSNVYESTALLDGNTLISVFFKCTPAYSPEEFHEELYQNLLAHYKPSKPAHLPTISSKEQQLRALIQIPEDVDLNIQLSSLSQYAPSAVLLSLADRDIHTVLDFMHYIHCTPMIAIYGRPSKIDQEQWLLLLAAVFKYCKINFPLP